MFADGWFWLGVLGAVPIYWQLPMRFRVWFLLILSGVYLGFLDWFATLTFTGWGILFYLALPQTANKNWRRFITPGLLILLLAFLFFFKYLPPMLKDPANLTALKMIGLPLGISYFTFKLIHFTIELSRGEFSKPNLPTLLCYLLFAPIFTAGPIERFPNFTRYVDAAFEKEHLWLGMYRIAFGLIKKFFILPFLAFDLQLFVSNLSLISTHEVFFHLVKYYLFIYIDFSAYCDLAIGVSRFFGFKITENFQFPIIAANPQDFWRRWHRTLSSWCRDYVFMPVLGLTRSPVPALFAALLVMGLWHTGSMSRLCWGIYHASGIIIFRLWRRWFPPAELEAGLFRRLSGIAPTFVFITFSIVFIIAETTGGINTALLLFKRFASWG